MLAAGLTLVPADFVAPAGSVATGRYPPLEAWMREEAAQAGRRDVRTPFAFVVGGHIACPPAAAADAILDAAREKHALDADEAIELARVPTASGERRALSIALLHMGQAPFFQDFRWDLEILRRDRPDGSVLLRYERSTARGPGLHVSVFRGVAALTPEGDGTRWIEVLAVASDIKPPFFLADKVEGAVRGILGRRWKRLCQTR